MVTGQEPPPPQISVAVGVIVGLLASFVQSLGLTIQRKSHLQNEALPTSLRKPDHRRKLWIVGFVVFITSNLLGTIFQVGTLPMVVLGPLGAVSLLFNAGFARMILGDEFTIHLIVGTFLIAGGAVLIGIFGVVPESTHTLNELVALYSRPPFIIWISLLCFSIFLLALSAHITEWAFERQIIHLATLSSSSPSSPSTPLTLTPRHSSTLWRKRSRRESIMNVGSLSAGRPRIPSDTQSAPGRVPTYGSLSLNLSDATDTTFEASHRSDSPEPILMNGNGNGHDTPPSSSKKGGNGTTTPGQQHDEELGSGGGNAGVLSAAVINRTRLILGVAYGSVSGTLSGLCLLFAKTGIELLILTVVGKNQFGNYRAWLIILVLLVAAVLQLFYLNRALRLVGPTLICPLAFCFYNLSSIISGLIYFDEWKLLSALQFGLVSLGTAILLAGVWIVSIRTAPEQEGREKEGGRDFNEGGLLSEEPESEAESDDDDDEDEEPMNWLPRGLSIGISASSPGFDIRPSGRRHTRTATLPTSSTFASLASAATDEDTTPLLSHPSRTASEADIEVASGELLRRRRKARQRGFSMSGNLYVGEMGSGLSGLGLETTSAPNSPVPGAPPLRSSTSGDGTHGETRALLDSPSGQKSGWRARFAIN